MTWGVSLNNFLDDEGEVLIALNDLTFQALTNKQIFRGHEYLGLFKSKCGIITECLKVCFSFLWRHNKQRDKMCLFVFVCVCVFVCMCSLVCVCVCDMISVQLTQGSRIRGSIHLATSTLYLMSLIWQFHHPAAPGCGHQQLVSRI